MNGSEAKVYGSSLEVSLDWKALWRKCLSLTIYFNFILVEKWYFVMKLKWLFFVQNYEKKISLDKIEKENTDFLFNFGLILYKH